MSNLCSATKYINFEVHLNVHNNTCNLFWTLACGTRLTSNFQTLFPHPGVVFLLSTYTRLWVWHAMTLIPKLSYLPLFINLLNGFPTNISLNARLSWVMAQNLQFWNARSLFFFLTFEQKYCHSMSVCLESDIRIMKVDIFDTFNWTLSEWLE